MNKNSKTISIHIFAENGKLGDKKYGGTQQIPVPDLPEFGCRRIAPRESEEVQRYRVRYESSSKRLGLSRST